MEEKKNDKTNRYSKPHGRKIRKQWGKRNFESNRKIYIGDFYKKKGCNLYYI